jgi:predicted DNA-binding transcriptional regulator AlpA
MLIYSTRQAAKKLGLPSTTLAQYIAANKVPAPKPVKIGNVHVRAWTEQDIGRVREILPKIANGRKTRHKKVKKRAKKTKP